MKTKIALGIRDAHEVLEKMFVFIGFRFLERCGGGRDSITGPRVFLDYPLEIDDCDIFRHIWLAVPVAVPVNVFDLFPK
jgi:hypothetical protein